jgi:hypothetical protein
VPVSHLLAVFQLPLPVIHLIVAMRPSPGLGTGSFFRSHLLRRTKPKSWVAGPYKALSNSIHLRFRYRLQGEPWRGLNCKLRMNGCGVPPEALASLQCAATQAEYA